MNRALTRATEIFCVYRTGIHKKVMALVVCCFLLAFLFSSQLPTSAYADVYSSDIVSWVHNPGC